ncbi:MAG: isoprenylcysteine carboxylmethyltransferase family protein [Chloroflexi bacterium]|nr:isoprenylcysteine carboxylmethyltransferase family protein [Chloroflexota bacterium]MBV9133905.1 isoprenylcysteine carboxylmethyltransferase family protein [Chloroflexota bacterium]MBV9892893.1 isoprenylcysteine carboxylmethyltransferase family protein [Chloroflexota bacterium]
MAPLRVWYWLVRAFHDVESTRLGGVLLGNVWPAYVFALPLAARLWGFLHNQRDGSLHAQAQWLQELVTIIFLALVVLLFAIRRRRISREHATFVPGLVALVGTFLLNVVAYLPVEDTTSTEALLVSSAIVIVGTLWTIWSLAFLGRCFGLFPEARGLVQSGPYRLVRHPVYLGELISAVGMLVAKPHPLIVLVFGVFVALQYGRTVYEERALRAAFPEAYTAYAARVGRLIPGLR